MGCLGVVCGPNPHQSGYVNRFLVWQFSFFDYSMLKVTHIPSRRDSVSHHNSRVIQVNKYVLPILAISAEDVSVSHAIKAPIELASIVTREIIRSTVCLS